MASGTTFANKNDDITNIIKVVIFFLGGGGGGGESPGFPPSK